MAKGKYHDWITPEGLLILEGWARDGLTDEQIADNMGIGVSTLYEWKNKFAEITEALKNGKEVIDRHVENALLKRALGYQYDEVIKESVKDYDENTDKTVYRLVETKRITKEVQPDVTAQIYWLKNRKPKNWRDKPDSEERIKKLVALLTSLNLSKEEIDGLMEELK